MAQQNLRDLTQADLEAALDYAIDLLEAVKVVVHGAMCQDGRVVFRGTAKNWQLMTLAVRGRPGCDCQSAGRAER